MKPLRRFHEQIICSFLTIFLLLPSILPHVIPVTQALSFTPKSSSSVPSIPRIQPPFQLKRLDHIVIRCHNFPRMFHFYTEVLGCTIDNKDTDVNRFDGVLTHLRAGDAYIDLLAYDLNHVTTEKGLNALIRMHSGGQGIDEHTFKDYQFSSETSSLDHLCLRIDPFDEEQIRNFMNQNNVQIIGSGDRKGAEGVGPSVYIEDPEGNVIELKGPSFTPSELLSNDGKTTSNFSTSIIDKTDSITPDKDTPISTSSSVSRAESNFKSTPCNRICRYNANFYNGQVCIGCFREAYEIGTWTSMTDIERYYTLLDAADREDSSDNLDGSISKEELLKQAQAWKERAEQ